MKEHEMKNTIKKTEYILLKYLGLSLRQSAQSDKSPSLTAKEWEQVLTLADRHEVLPLLGYVVESEKLPEEQRLAMEYKTAKTVHKGIQLQALNARLTVLLAEAGIRAVTLKGCAVARFYPVPEFRKTTDIDLFAGGRQEFRQALKILCEHGFKTADGWHANHHAVLVSEKNEVVELHATWTEAFREKHLNQYLERLQKEGARHVRLTDCRGSELYVYDTAWQGFYLMIHMLQHFVGSGFGLRNLCDWVVLWENCSDEKERSEFWRMACESGSAAFAETLTSICVRYLGLMKEKSPVPVEKLAGQELSEALLRDILDAGEFGYSEEERMVGMDGNSLLSFVREFHHQMHINFPKAGRIAAFWPVLWSATLVRFLNNNRKLNRRPVSAIMKKAAKRGELVSRLLSRHK